MTPEERLQLARSVFADDRFAALSGITIETLGHHEACCSLALDERHLNARGVAMGGVLFTLADFCAAIAANSECLPELHWVSLDSNIHFLAPARGRLTAHCTALKAGRSTALFQTQIESLDLGKTVAVVETTMICSQS